MGGNAAIVSGVAACKKEIPAYAGMVCWWAVDCWRIWLCVLSTIGWVAAFAARRFLPTQEWSGGGRWIVGGFGFVFCRQLGGLPLSRQGDSCLRRNGLVGERKSIGEYGIVVVAVVVAETDIFPNDRHKYCRSVALSP